MEKCIKSCLLECEVVDIWDERFESLKKFIDESKKRPSTHSRNKDEKNIGTWLISQNNYHKNRIYGMKNDKRYNVWSKFTEQYSEYFDIWNTNFVKSKEFIDTNHIIPSVYSKNSDEKFISGWLSNQSRNYKNRINGMKNDERRDVWCKFLEQYNEYFVSFDDIWNTNFDKLKEYIDTNNKRPSEDSNNKDEKIIGKWLGTQNQNYKNKRQGMKDDERRDVWCKFLEQYNEYFVSFDDIWNTNFDKLKEYIDTNNKRPSEDSNNKDEKIIGKWLGTQNQNYKNKRQGMKDDERRDVWCKFLEQYNEYFDKWNTNFDKLKDFIDTNKKRPSTTSKNKDEKFIGSWSNTQNNNYKNRRQGMEDDERRDLWCKFLEQYNAYFDT